MTTHTIKPDARLRLVAFADGLSTSWAGIVALVLICTIPVACLHLPPMTDLLGHMGRYAVQVNLPTHPRLAEYYGFHWRMIGNLGADLIVQVLAPWQGIVAATRSVLILDQMLATTGILFVSRAIHGRITPYALFALPLNYGFSFTFGFVNFTLSMALAMNAFALWLHMERPDLRLWRIPVFAGVSVALFICHTYGWVFLGILCTAQSLVELHDRTKNSAAILAGCATRCAPLLVPLAFLLAWRGAQGGGETDGWFLMLLKLGNLLGVLRLDNMVFDLASAFVLLAVIYGAIRLARVPLDHRMALAALIAMAGYVLLPLQVFGSVYADARLAAYILVLLLLGLRPTGLEPDRRTLLACAALAFLALRLGATTAVYLDRQHRLETSLAALDHVPSGSRVLTLARSPCEGEWSYPWLTHIGGMAILRRDAFSNDQWDTPGMNLLSVRYRKPAPYIADPSQLFEADECKTKTQQLGDALRHAPLEAFTHVWILGAAPGRYPVAPEMKRVWSQSDSALYEIRSPAISKLSKFQP